MLCLRINPGNASGRLTTRTRSAMLHHLIYISRAVDHFDDVQLLALLNKARIKNHQHQISGLLLYEDRTFVQYIEGPLAQLNQLKTAISHDIRHSIALYLLQEPNEEGRLFPDWSMGYNHMRVLNRMGIPGLQENDLDEVRYHLEKQPNSFAASILMKIIEANHFS